MLKTCARTNVSAGFPPPMAMRSLNLVSSPMERKARANQIPRRLEVSFVSALADGSLRSRETTSDATMKPRTNLGNLLQISPAFGRSTPLCG